MRTFLKGTGAALVVPVIILNWSGVIIGGIWLAFLHEWALLIFGIGMLFFGRYQLALLLAIGLRVGAGGLKLPSLTWLFFGLALTVDVAVLTIWTVWIFDFAVNRPHENVWPYMLWGYAAVNIPWVQIASEEKATDPKMQTFSWFAAVQFGSLAVMGSVLFGEGYRTRFDMALFFLPVAVLGALLAICMEPRGTA
jgi:hypothetical protein